MGHRIGFDCIKLPPTHYTPRVPAIIQQAKTPHKFPKCCVEGSAIPQGTNALLVLRQKLGELGLVTHLRSSPC